jgi:hypothetical protein
MRVLLTEGRDEDLARTRRWRPGIDPYERRDRNFARTFQGTQFLGSSAAIAWADGNWRAGLDANVRELTIIALVCASASAWRGRMRRTFLRCSCGGSSHGWGRGGSTIPVTAFLACMFAGGGLAQCS